MDLTTIIGIVGAIASVVGVGVYFIKKRNAGCITLFKVNSTGLADFIRKWDELTVRYKSNEVKENLVLFIGILRNTGPIDITREMTEERVTIKIPKGYRWLDAKKIQTSSKVRVTIAVTDLELHFDIGMFKPDEHIRFEALAEVPKSAVEKFENAGASLAENLKIDYRITNTGNAVVEDLSLIGLASKTRMRKLALASGVVLAVCFGASFLWVGDKKQPTFMMNDNGQPREVMIDFRTDKSSSVDVTDVSTGKPKTLTLDQVRNGHITPTTPSQASFIVPFILIVILAPMALFLTSFSIEKKRRSKLLSFLASCEPLPPTGEPAN
jgi:hypothetical protein